MPNFHSTTILGDLKVTGDIISTAPQGESPLIVQSTTTVSNFSADLLDGKHGSHYENIGNLTGTISATVLAKSTLYVGTTAIALNRASAGMSLTGVSIDGTSTGVVRTVTGTGQAELVRGNMGDSDQARILIGATASNAGFLEISTADDGTEPIYVRQYTGTFATLARTATLLDADGNTAFPNNLSSKTLSLSLPDDGDAPMTVASKVMVNNLNVQYLDGKLSTDFYPSSNPDGFTPNEGTVTSITAGNGMNFDAISTTGAVKLGTPSTLTSSTTNSVTSTSHTHEITTYNLSGTSNQITVTGAAKVLGDVTTLSLPQNIHTGATPLFSSMSLKKDMTNGDTAAFTNPHLALVPNSNVDLTGFVGMTMATSTTANYGYSLGAKRTTNGNGNFVIRSHQENATGNEVFRLNVSGDLNIPGSFNANDIIAAGDVVVDGGDIKQTAKTGTNVVGTELSISSGQGTGSGTPTSIKFKTSSTTAVATDTQPLLDRMTISADGVTVHGDFRVDGTTKTINSTVVTIDDPVLTLGGDTAPTSNDGKDRGIEYRWHDGTSAKLGFFGLDRSIQRFTYIPDATNASEVFSGNLGIARFNSLELMTSGTKYGTISTSELTSNQTYLLPNLSGTVALTSNLHNRSHTMTSTSDHTAGNWKAFYSNGSGQVVELALGTAGHYLRSGGAAAAPTFAQITYSEISGTPSISISAGATDGIFDITGTGGTNSVSYAVAPYAAKTVGGFDRGAVNPDGTTRINWNGYLYGTKLYSGGKEVYTSDNLPTYPEVNDGALALAVSSTSGATNTTITIETGTGFTANEPAGTVTYKHRVGPALTALATTMTGTGSGFLKKTAQDTYILDTNTYLTSFTESDTLESVTSRGNTTTNNLSIGGLTVTGSLTSGGGSTYSNYVAGADNIILKGNAAGVSGLFFESEKDGTSINHPSDYAFIQYHPYGIGGSTGESGRLVIGVSNDATTDKLVLNPPGSADLVVRLGVATTEYQVWHAANDGSGSGLDADLLDGKHASAFYLATNPSGYTTNEGTVTSVAAGNGMNFTTITGTGSVTMGTPSTLTNATTNEVTATSHTHAITNYGVSGTTNQITVSGSPKVLGSATTLSLPQNIHTGATPTFARLSLSQPMTSGTTAAFTSPHLALVPTNQVDNTGFVGMTFATSTAANYGFSLGALRSTDGSGSIVIRNHSNNATGTEIFRLDAAGNLTIPGKMIVSETEVSSTSNGVLFEGSVADDFEGLLKAGTLTADRTYTLPDLSGTIALTSQIGNASLKLTASAGATNTAVTIGTGTGFTANDFEDAIYDIDVGPALTNLAAIMTGAGSGFLKKAGQDTYTIDTNTYLTSQSNDFGTVTVSDTDSGHTWTGTGSAVSDKVGDTLTVVSGSGINVDVSATTDAIRIANTDRGSSQNIFKNFTDGTTTAVADSNNDTFKFIGSGVTVAVQNDNATHGDNLLISWTHPDTSDQDSVNNSNGTVIQDITLDPAGHVTGIGSYDLDNRYAPVVNLTVATAASTAAKVTTETVTFADNTIYMVRFTLGNTVSSPTLNGVNIRIGTTNASTTTFNFSGEAIVPLVYDETLNKLQIMGSFDTSDGTESYTVRWNSNLQAGAQGLAGNKLTMFGADGKLYGLTREYSTGTTKTVESTPLDLGKPILWYGRTTNLAANAVSSSYWYNGVLCDIRYTANQASGTFAAYQPIYVVGTINEDGLLVLDGSGTTGTGFLTQTLPTTEDGKVYVFLGVMHDASYNVRITTNNPAYIFKNGKIKIYSGYADTANKLITTQKSDSVAYNIPFVSGLTNDTSKEFYTDSAANLTYNPSTNTLSTATFNGSLVNSVSGTGSLELVRGNMADNDQFRILVGGTASNAGYAEIATADDGTEPIYVRQYTGVFSNLQRTLTLLDGSGNTSIPGSLTVAGNLTINGTTTTINTETLNVSDNIVVLNNDVTGTPTENAGIEVERGTSANTSIRWNETSDRWEFTNNGTNYHNIPLNTEYNKYEHPETPLTQAAGTETTLTSVTLIDSLTTNSTGHLTEATWRKLVAGSNVAITPAANGNITIASTNTWNANSKSVAGYVAAPGAVANKVWKTDDSGNPAWRDDANTTYTVFTASVDGLVPTPGESGSTKFLRQDGTWVVPTDTNTWNANSKSVAGYVAAPGAVSNKVWKTDSSGNPAWRDDADTNTASAVDNILDGSNSGTAITYAPYSAQQAKLSFDTSTTDPTRTDRLNLNGYLYASRLHSLGIYGGNLASGNLTIGSTSHATKGSVSIDSNTAIAGSVTVGSATVNGTNSGTMQYNSTTKSIEFIFN